MSLLDMSSCESLMITPQKPLHLVPDEIYFIEDIEKKLENFSHLLDRSSEKEKSYMKKLSEQSVVISSLKEENEGLIEENKKLRLNIENHMKNFKCFIENLKRTSALEEENLVLKKQIDHTLNETSDKIVDLELEKDHIHKVNRGLVKQNEDLKEQNQKLRADVNRLNEFVVNSFHQTLGYSREEKIKTLEKKLNEREKETLEFKKEFEKSKDNYEKHLKQKTLEYELLKMDYQSAIVQNIQARQTTWKDEKTKTEKADKNEKSLVLSKNQTSKKSFNMVNSKSTNRIDTTRKAKTAMKRNTAILTVKEQIENDSGDSDNDEEPETNNNDGSLEEGEEDDEDDEPFTIKKGKRKAKDVKKKQQTKKVKKNENKELLLINRNTIQYHLFN